MLDLHEVKKVYVCRHNYHIDEDGQECCVCEVVIDDGIAERLDSSYQLATIEEVNMCIEDIEYEDGFVKVIEVEEGIFGYYEISYIDNLGDLEWFGSYVKIGMSSEQKIKDFRYYLERSKR